MRLEMRKVRGAVEVIIMTSIRSTVLNCHLRRVGIDLREATTNVQLRFQFLETCSELLMISCRLSERSWRLEKNEIADHQSRLQ